MFRKRINSNFDYLFKKMCIIEYNLNNMDLKLNDILRLLNNNSNDPITNKIHQWAQLRENQKK